MTTTTGAPALETDDVPTEDDTYSTDTTFVSLGVSPDLCDALAKDGIETAFPIQAMTIADALAGRDVCGKAKTGSGKTLGFGLPVLMVPSSSSRAARRLLVASSCCPPESSPSRSTMCWPRSPPPSASESWLCTAERTSSGRSRCCVMAVR